MIGHGQYADLAAAVVALAKANRRAAAFSHSRRNGEAWNAIVAERKAAFKLVRQLRVARDKAEREAQHAELAT